MPGKTEAPETPGVGGYPGVGEGVKTNPLRFAEDTKRLIDMLTTTVVNEIYDTITKTWWGFRNDIHKAIRTAISKFIHDNASEELKISFKTVNPAQALFQVKLTMRYKEFNNKAICTTTIYFRRIYEFTAYDAPRTKTLLFHPETKCKLTIHMRW